MKKKNRRAVRELELCNLELFIENEILNELLNSLTDIIRPFEMPIVRDTSFIKLDDIVLDSKEKLDEFTDGLIKIEGSGKKITVADVYDLLGMGFDAADTLFGWRNTNGITVTYDSSKPGWRLCFPHPTLIRLLDEEDEKGK